MKIAEKKQKMIEIFEKGGFKGSQVRKLIDQCLSIDAPNPKLIEQIKIEMDRWYGFELTDYQIKEYLKESPDLDSFDTYEREDFLNYLAQTITQMNWPMNMDDQTHKDKFYESLKENAPKFGYKWLGQI